MAYCTPKSVIPGCLGICEVSKTSWGYFKYFSTSKDTVYAPYIYLHKLTITSSLFWARIISVQSGNCLAQVTQKF